MLVWSEAIFVRPDPLDGRIVPGIRGGGSHEAAVRKASHHTLRGNREPGGPVRKIQPKRSDLCGRSAHELGRAPTSRISEVVSRAVLFSRETALDVGSLW